MLANFTRDLGIGRRAEVIALEVFRQLTNDFTFEDVANQKEYYHIGDIKAIEKATGDSFFLEIKNDSRIADTHNVLCEDSVYYYRDGVTKQGNMYNQGTRYYCVVSERERKIYMIDFFILQSIYKKRGRFIRIPHAEQESNCYLVSLKTLEEAGALKGTINY